MAAAKNTSVAAASPLALLNSGFSTALNITVDGQLYSASADAALRSGTYTTWLHGSLVNEYVIAVPLKTSAGVEHPHLTARFSIRWYQGLSKKARVEVVVENDKTFTAAPRNFTYDVNVQVGGHTAYTQTGLTHYHHSRWHKLMWWDESAAPLVNLKHNTAYLIATKAVPNYDQSVKIDPQALSAYVTQLKTGMVGPMKIGPVVEYMPTSGGRPDIGPLPSWSVVYILSMDQRAKDMMLAAGDGAASWSIHYRDEKTGQAVRLDNDVNRKISTHGNLNHLGPLPVPRCANNDWNLCKTPYSADAAHQPSLAYLPYLVTGDQYYLEELQFWAAWNPLGTDPGYHGYELGLVRWDQVRGQAWSMRTLGQVAYITPDSDAMKAYWQTQLNNNLDYYNTSFVINNPNNLGAYDGSGAASFDNVQSAPWQDDFLTWSFGYLSELGFTKATPILAWKSKYPVGRMTAPGFCFIEGAAYFLNIRPAPGQPVYKTFADVYTNMYKDNLNLVDDDGHVLKNPLGLKYIDQPCGSQAQADWRSASGPYTWQRGRMTGYSSSPTGFPSNMQPALAVAAASGIPNASLAWTTFMSRSVKPDYSTSPQWAIVPR